MKKVLSLILTLLILTSVFVFNVSAAQLDVTELSYDATNENCIKLDDAIEAYEEENDVILETYRNYFYIPDGTESFFDGEDSEVPSWYNEYFSDVCIWYNSYMCDNAPTPLSYCGYSINKTEANNIYYADIPVGVEMFVINNGVDSAEPIYSACCSADLGPEEADGEIVYHDNMIYVLHTFDSASMSSTAYFYGDWYYYYGDGCYGTVVSGTTKNCIRNDHEHQEESDYLYKDRFIEEYGYVQGSWGYNELYYHYTDDNTIDWVLVRAHIYIMVEPTDNPIYSHYVMGDIVYSTYYHYAPFETEYGIYDVAKDEFLDITKIDFDQYSGLRKVVYEKIDGRPIGDCDKDRELSILDATAIQRELALIQKIENDYFWNNLTHAFQRYADFDRDGDVSIMDATAIQRRLAKLDVPVATPDEV